MFGIASFAQVPFASLAMGNQAMRFNTTGGYSTAIGREALKAQTTGGYNTAVGNQAGAQTTGSFNTFIGMQSGYSNTSGTGNITIGYGADVSSAASANEINIAYNTSGAGSNFVSFGKAGNLVYNQFTVNSSWTRSSDVRLKKDIQDDTLGLEFICKIQPRTYKWKPSNEVPQELTRHYSEENNMDLEATMNGFIAQEVKQALDEVGAVHQGVWSVESDGTQAVSREMFVMPLINAIKELNTLVTAQAAEITALKAKVGI